MTKDHIPDPLPFTYWGSFKKTLYDIPSNPHDFDNRMKNLQNLLLEDPKIKKILFYEQQADLILRELRNTRELISIFTGKIKAQSEYIKDLEAQLNDKR